jgi:hypothetical protein
VLARPTFLVQEALKVKDRKILITTFTDENVREIKKKFIDINGFIPHNIHIKVVFISFTRLFKTLSMCFE